MKGGFLLDTKTTTIQNIEKEDIQKLNHALRRKSKIIEFIKLISDNEIISELDEEKIKKLNENIIKGIKIGIDKIINSNQLIIKYNDLLQELNNMNYIEDEILIKDKNKYLSKLLIIKVIKKIHLENFNIILGLKISVIDEAQRKKIEEIASLSEEIDIDTIKKRLYAQNPFLNVEQIFNQKDYKKYLIKTLIYLYEAIIHYRDRGEYTISSEEFENEYIYSEINNFFEAITNVLYYERMTPSRFLNYVNNNENQGDIYADVLGDDEDIEANEESDNNNNTTNITGGRKTKKNNKKNKGTKKNKKEFLYNPNDPSKSFDVYINKNPSDTIPIKYTTIDDVKNTIKKLERLFKTKKYPHKRIWQVGMIMKVRLEAMLKHKTNLYKKAKNVNKRFNLANKYFKFLGERTKKNTFKERKDMVFNY